MSGGHKTHARILPVAQAASAARLGWLHLGPALGAAAWLALAAGGAFGQTPTTPEVPPPPVGPDAPPEQIRPGPPIGAPGTGGTLSEELSRSGGVITPPQNVDPGMVQPPPDGGAATTPVIPPPGSPGGDPNVQPK